MGKEEMLLEVYDKAKGYELKCGNCAQGTIAAIFEIMGVQEDGVFKAATGLADGVGLSGDGHCGALSGGTMVISYFFGRSKDDFGRMGKQIRALKLSKKLHDEFVEEFSTCRCADIQKKQFGRFFNLYDFEEMAEALKAGMPEKCATLVGKTARMTLRIVLDEMEARKAKQAEFPVL